MLVPESKKITRVADRCLRPECWLIFKMDLRKGRKSSYLDNLLYEDEPALYYDCGTGSTYGCLAFGILISAHDELTFTKRNCIDKTARLA